MKARNKKVSLAAGLAAAVVFGGSVLATQTITTIWSFTGVNGDGEYPNGPLTFDSSGAIYGTDESGGNSYNGTVFQLIPPSRSGGWSESVLYRFAGGSDGRQPSQGVVFDASGILYGTTYNGGSQNCGGGCGTVFDLTPPSGGGAWTHNVLYTFQGVYDGQAPGAVVFGPGGTLYGTTSAGGPAFPPCNRIGCGTVFQLTPPGKKGGSWNKTMLYSFPSKVGDGRAPNPGIVFDQNGNIYGTTNAGGTSNYYGTVYQLSPPKSGNTWTETVLHSFTNGNDGGYPIGGLTIDSNGVLYGTASGGGGANSAGVVFRLTPPSVAGSWTYEVIYKFGGGSDGNVPAATMAFDQSGNLYGTTWYGGSSACYQGCGTIFKLSPSGVGGAWVETVLYDLTSSGNTPNGSDLEFRNGLLYGTTYYLGSANVGSVFTMVP